MKNGKTIEFNIWEFDIFRIYFKRYNKALNPMRYSRQVYKFLGEKFTPKIEKTMKDAIEPPKTAISDKGKATYTTNRKGYPYL